MPYGDKLYCPFCGTEAKMEDHPDHVNPRFRYAFYCTATYCGGTTALCTTPERAYEYFSRRAQARKEADNAEV